MPAGVSHSQAQSPFDAGPAAVLFDELGVVRAFCVFIDIPQCNIRFLM